jgi:hypothetical protein
VIFFYSNHLINPKSDKVVADNMALPEFAAMKLTADNELTILDPAIPGAKIIFAPISSTRSAIDDTIAAFIGPSPLYAAYAIIPKAEVGSSVVPSEVSYAMREPVAAARLRLPCAIIATPNPVVGGGNKATPTAISPAELATATPLAIDFSVAVVVPGELLVVSEELVS